MDGIGRQSVAENCLILLCRFFVLAKIGESTHTLDRDAFHDYATDLFRIDCNTPMVDQARAELAKQCSDRGKIPNPG